MDKWIWVWAGFLSAFQLLLLKGKVIFDHCLGILLFLSHPWLWKGPRRSPTLPCLSASPTLCAAPGVKQEKGLSADQTPKRRLPRTALVWFRPLTSKSRGSKELQAPMPWPLGSISATGNQAKNQFMDHGVGANCGDFPSHSHSPRILLKKSLTAFTDGIKGYLEKQAFPRKWGSLFDSQCKKKSMRIRWLTM